MSKLTLHMAPLSLYLMFRLFNMRGTWCICHFTVVLSSVWASASLKLNCELNCWNGSINGLPKKPNIEQFRPEKPCFRTTRPSGSLVPISHKKCHIRASSLSHQSDAICYHCHKKLLKSLIYFSGDNLPRKCSLTGLGQVFSPTCVPE